MKKITFSLYVALLTLLPFPQNSNSQTEYRLNSLETFYWEDPDWIVQTRDLFTYDDPDASFTSLLTEQYNSSSWDPVFQKIRTYNEDNTLNTDISQFYNAGWMDQFKSEYDYNPPGTNTMITHYNANGVGGWLESQQDRLTYNGSGHNDVTERYMWNFVMSDWDESLRIEYTYAGDLLMKQEDFNWNLILTDWETSTHHTIDYTYNGNLLNDATEQSDLGSGLENTNRTEYFYIAGKLDTETYKIWNTGAWVDDSELKYYYHPNGQINEIIYSSEPTTERSTLALTPQIKIVYNWITLGINSKNLFKGKAYPNPFQNKLTISLKSELEGEGTLQMLDIHGKEISNIELRQGVKSIQINNPYLSKGLYFVHVTSGVEKSVFKVIKD
jgi:hypothetical protein